MVKQWYYQTAICGSKKSWFIKNLEAKGLLSKVLKHHSVKYQYWVIFYLKWVRIKMSKIVNKFWLAGDKFMPETHLKEPWFTYSANGPFTKNKERIQKVKETGDTGYIYKNELDKACF